MISKYLGKNILVYLEENKIMPVTQSCDVSFIFLLATWKSEITQCLILGF